MSLLGDPVKESQAEVRSEIDRLRRYAAECIEAASRLQMKSAVDMLVAISREYEEQALRLEAMLITSRVIQ